MENWEKLSKLSKDKIIELQNKKLVHFLKNEIQKHPYYKSLFLKNKIKLNDIKSVKDIAKLPFTSKEDIAPTKNNPGLPLRFVLQDRNEKYKPIHVHFTAGRTAAPTPFYYTAYDIENMKEVGKRMMSLIKADKKEVAVNAFPYAPHLAFWQAYFALNACGIMALHSGGGKILGSEKIIKSIIGMNATALLAMPGYAYHLLRIAADEKTNLSSLNKIILGGERISEGLRNKIKNLLKKDVKIYGTYGFTEGKSVWVQCNENSGYHLYPDLEYIEVVDDEGNNVSEGEKGEIVYSALDWKGSVVLRYKTGDTGSVAYNKCEYCGRNLPRIGSEIERKSEVKEFNLVKLKGNLVNMNSFYEIINGFDEVVEWQIELRKKNNDPYELDEIYLYVSVKERTDFEKLKNKINEVIKDALEISFNDIIKLSLNEIIERLGMERELKERRIVDRR